MTDQKIQEHIALLLKINPKLTEQQIAVISEQLRALPQV
jgi:hypothetical protein